MTDHLALTVYYRLRAATQVVTFKVRLNYSFYLDKETPGSTRFQ